MIKRLFSAFLTMCFVGMYSAPAFAFGHLQKDYWAAKEIESVVKAGIMALDENGEFNPELAETRVGFVQSLLKILGNENLNVKIQNKFTDVTEEDSYYKDILRSEQLGLVYGYPDNTFRPNQELLRSEVTSIISHITKDKYTDITGLKNFSDYDALPEWALMAYSKTIHYGIYVNHPDENALEPNRALTRAEAAVLLYRLKQKLNVVKEEYVGEAEFIVAEEHLDVNKKAPCDTVVITNKRDIIKNGNVLLVAFDEKYFSKTSQNGEVVNFVAKENLYTREGSLVYPANTKFVADVIKLQKPKWFNKNARVYMMINQVVLPDGRTYSMYAKPFTKDYALVEGPWMTFGRLVLYTLGFGAVGTGAGIGFGFIPNPAKLGTGVAIGTPIGCAVGLGLGLILPGLHYKAKKGEEVYFILTDDSSIYNK